MKSYNKFIGIDIGKKTFVVAIHGERSTQEYDNDEQGIAQFIKEKKEILNGHTLGSVLAESKASHFLSKGIFIFKHR